MLPPLVYVAVAWAAGLVVARHWLVPLGVEPAAIACLAVIPLAAALLWREDRAVKLAAACALALLAGAARYQVAVPAPDDAGHVAFYAGRGPLVVEGTVRAFPDVRDTWTYLTLAVDGVEVDGQARPVRGQIRVTADRYPQAGYGDRLRLEGELEIPGRPDGFDYRAYLAGRDVYAIMAWPRVERLATGQGQALWTGVLAFRERAQRGLARLVPEPEASLLQGIVLGIRSGISRDLYDAYNATGLSHIIVISGSNITFLARLFGLTFGRLLGKRRAYWLTMAGIALYVLLVGADAAVVRAGLMGGLYVTALHLGRQATAYVSLAVSAMILTAASPLALWDAGFQLSFAATLSLILFAPLLERWWERGLAPDGARGQAPDDARGQATDDARGQARLAALGQVAPLARWLRDVLLTTLAAQVLTVPLIAYHFGRLSPVSPLANLLVLPVQAPVMALGGLAALAGSVTLLEPVARVVAWVPWLCLAYTNLVVRWLASWPLASLAVGQVGWQWLAAYYGALAGLAWARRHRPAGQRAAPRPAVLGLGLAVAILAGLALLQRPDGRLHVAFLDVGQGDAILITTPRGGQVLVDGGPSPGALQAALGRQMPFWDRSLDAVVATHADEDHIAGLPEILERFRVGLWLDNGRASDEVLYAECQALLERQAVPIQTLRAGDRLDLGDGVVVEVLHPAAGTAGEASADNDSSLVVRLSWGAAGFLLTGDVGAAAETALLDAGRPLGAGVLKIAHHGSGGSSTASFLQAVSPLYAVISVSSDNKFGHPDPAVLERLAALPGLAVLRTDQAGTVEFVTDGARLWVRTEQ